MSGPFNIAEALEGLTPKQRGDVMKEQEVIAVIRTAEYGKSKQKQTDQWAFEAEMLDGPWLGETLEGQIYWTAKAAQMATQSLAALGITTEWILENRPQPDEIADRMVGVKAVFNVTINEFRGRKTNRLEPKEFLGREDAGEGYAGLEEFGSETSSNPAAVKPPAATQAEVPNGTAGAAVADLPADSAGDSDDLWAAAQ